MRRHSLRVLLFSLLIVVVSLSVIAPVAATPGVISIGAARALPVGTQVTIQGGVTVPSGRFSSATFDQGFAIQDPTGGIYVSVPTSNNLRVGNRARVTGTLAVSYNLLILVGSNVQRLPGATLVPTQFVRTGNVGGSNEGELVTVIGRITQPPVSDQPYGYRVFINDGSGEVQLFIHTTSGINPFNLWWVTPGRRVIATGFSGYFDDHTEVDPRFPIDFLPLPG